MWLELSNRYELIRYEPDQSAVPWRVDVVACVDDDAFVQGKPDSFVVGRLLADEIRRYKAEEWGVSAWDVADADSSGLEGAFASLLDEESRMRDDIFNPIADPI